MKEKKEELMKVLINGVEEVEGLAGEIRERLLRAAKGLRVEQSEETFRSLSTGIENLKDLMAFLEQMKEGLKCLKDLSIPEDRLKCWDRSVELFQDMLSAFEMKDWITVADLIEYELSPLLEEGERSLKELGTVLKG